MIVIVHPRPRKKDPVTATRLRAMIEALIEQSRSLRQLHEAAQSKLDELQREIEKRSSAA